MMLYWRVYFSNKTTIFEKTSTFNLQEEKEEPSTSKNRNKNFQQEQEFSTSNNKNKNLQPSSFLNKQTKLWQPFNSILKFELK